jgi:carboxylesterase
VLHGITGTPSTVRGLAESLAAVGFTVELPLLPGHGTTMDDLLATGWADWTGAVEAAFADLAGRCQRVVVAGLSMGGTLSLWLAARHPEVCGVVAVNPLVDPPAPSFRQMLHEVQASGIGVMPGIGSDIAKGGVHESAYEGTPIEPLLSLFEGVDELLALLPGVRCPVLVVTSRQDHVVPPVSSEVLCERLGGPVERLWLERSYHVATLDHDRPELEERAVEFATRVVKG